MNLRIKLFYYLVENEFAKDEDETMVNKLFLYSPFLFIFRVPLYFLFSVINEAGKGTLKILQFRAHRLPRKKRWRHCCRALSHGWKNSIQIPSSLIRYLSNPPFILVSRFIFTVFVYICSRPKQVKDVAHQDEVVRVLTNTLETTNVLFIICFL